MKTALTQTFPGGEVRMYFSLRNKFNTYECEGKKSRVDSRKENRSMNLPNPYQKRGQNNRGVKNLCCLRSSEWGGGGVTAQKKNSHHPQRMLKKKG